MINREPRQIQNEAGLKEVWVLVLGFFMFLSAASSEPRSRLGGLGRTFGGACKEFEDSKHGILG